MNESLRALAEAAEQDGQHIYTNPRDSDKWRDNEAWHRAASPEAVTALPDRVKALEEGLNGVLLCGRGTSGRIILEGWQEEAARALLEKTT